MSQHDHHGTLPDGSTTAETKHRRRKATEANGGPKAKGERIQDSFPTHEGRSDMDGSDREEMEAESDSDLWIIAGGLTLGICVAIMALWLDWLWN